MAMALADGASSRAELSGGLHAQARRAEASWRLKGPETAVPHERGAALLLSAVILVGHAPRLPSHTARP